MKKIIVFLVLIMVISTIVVEGIFLKSNQEVKKDYSNESLYQVFDYEIEPKTLSIKVVNNGNKYEASKSQNELKVKNLNNSNDAMSWNYEDKQISVDVKKEQNYLSITLTNNKKVENMMSFPLVTGDEYYIPLGEGKRIPINDKIWNDYLTSMDFSMNEQLSMPFFSSIVGDKALVYILDNPNRSKLHFMSENELSFEVINNYSSLQNNNSLNYRIYLTDNDPVKIAKIYKEYIKEKGNFKTLDEKAKENENVKKLYGAPHIYLWNDRIITPDDIIWNKFLNYTQNDIMKYLLVKSKHLETYQEFETVLNNIKTQGYVDKYQKNVICRTLSDLLREKNIYDESIFKKTNKTIEYLLDKKELDQGQVIELNKNLLYENMNGAFKDISKWADSVTIDILNDMKSNGIENAWIGLDNWENAYAKPSIISSAKDNNYLIATYDSYHSIHESGKEEWNTASFNNDLLYEDATVSDINGKKIEGFNKVGRKLNPTLSHDEVKNRVSTILENGFNFNSWFIDCDATGEIYDDYSINHPTSKEDDLKARLERMSYIRNKKDMVIGSEGGNDFASNIIDFAHGIELPTFSWLDKDMKDKESKYYIGKYYSSNGGVPEHFGKQIEVKENLKHIFLDPRFNVPLYKLVYNDSVITTYHWDWSTLKIKNEVENRMLREVLYNVPSLYHLDESIWSKSKDIISRHTKEWANFSKEAIKNEMTDFKYLDDSRYIQKTEYGKLVYAICNFSDKEYVSEKGVIPAKSVLMGINGKEKIYTPTTK